MCFGVKFNRFFFRVKIRSDHQAQKFRFFFLKRNFNTLHVSANKKKKTGTDSGKNNYPECVIKNRLLSCAQLGVKCLRCTKREGFQSPEPIYLRASRIVAFSNLPIEFSARSFFLNLKASLFRVKRENSKRKIKRK